MPPATHTMRLGAGVCGAWHGYACWWYFRYLFYGRRSVSMLDSGSESGCANQMIKKTTRLDIRTHCGPIFGLVENSIEERGLGRGDIFQVRLQANIGNLNANGKNIFHNHIPVYKRFRSPAKIPIINLAAKFYKYQNYFSVHLQIALRTRCKAIPPSILKYSVLRANLVNLEKSQKYSKMHIGWHVGVVFNFLTSLFQIINV